MARLWNFLNFLFSSELSIDLVVIVNGKLLSLKLDERLSILRELRQNTSAKLNSRCSDVTLDYLLLLRGVGPAARVLRGVLYKVSYK